MSVTDTPAIETISRREVREERQERTRLGSEITVVYKAVYEVRRWPKGNYELVASFWEGEKGTGLIRRPGYSDGNAERIAAELILAGAR